MRIRIKKWGMVAMTVGLILLACVESSEPFYPYLNEQQIKEAIQHGEDNKDNPHVVEEWGVGKILFFRYSNYVIRLF